MRLPYLRSMGAMQPWGAPSELNPVTGVVTSPGRDSQGRTYTKKYVLDWRGECVEQVPGGDLVRVRQTTTPCVPGAVTPYGTFPVAGDSSRYYGDQSAPYSGRILQYSAQTGWDPREADAAQAQLRDFQQTIQQPAPIVSDTFITTQTGGGGGTFLPPAPSGTPAMQIEEFAAQPESVLPATLAPVEVKKGMSSTQILALLAAGALAYFWMKNR